MTLDFRFHDLQDSAALPDCSEWTADRSIDPPTIAGLAERPDEQLLVDLLGAVAGGSSLAFSKLHQHCRPWMMQAALRVLHKQELAEEAVQEGMIKLWQRAAQYYAPRGGARGWITVIARNQALDMLRQRRNLEVNMEFDLDESMGPIDDVQELVDWADNTRKLSAVTDVLATMPDAMRKSVLMSCYEGYTHTEIAQQMQAPVGTVKAWIRRGLQRLRSSIDAGDIPHFANA